MMFFDKENDKNKHSDEEIEINLTHNNSIRKRIVNDSISKKYSDNPFIEFMPDPIVTLKEEDFAEEERNLLSSVYSKTKAYHINCMPPLGPLYLKLPEELKRELVDHKIAYVNGRRRKYKGTDQCILRFFAYEDDYPEDVREEILDCILMLKGERSVNGDNKLIIQSILDDLVNRDWPGRDCFPQDIAELKKQFSDVIGRKQEIKQFLMAYNMFLKMRNIGPCIIRIKGGHPEADDFAKRIAASIGKYCEMSAQNLGMDSNILAGTSRIYCNSWPGDLGEAIVRNNKRVIIIRNLNDADKRNIDRLSSFFEGTFIENYYRITLPKDVVVICTESDSGNAVPEYIFDNATTIELSEYSPEDKHLIFESLVYEFNHSFGMELSFAGKAEEDILESSSQREIRNRILEIYSEISLEKALNNDESVLRRTIIPDDLVRI